MHILDAKIISNKNIAKDIYLLSCEAEEIASEARPGQFLMLKLNLPLPYILRRPFSICLTNIEKNELFILYKIRGKITGHMSRLKEGERISVMGPLGNGFDIPSNTSQIILLGGGIGVAPLISLLPIYNKGITFIAGYSSAKEYVDIKRIVKGDYTYIVCTEDGSIGHRGTCIDAFRDYMERPLSDNTVVLSCGPMPMLRKISEISKRLNIACYVSLETYMGCGMGLCQGCVIRTQHGYIRICKEGPVFKSEDICWNQA